MSNIAIQQLEGSVSAPCAVLGLRSRNTFGHHGDAENIVLSPTGVSKDQNLNVWRLIDDMETCRVQAANYADYSATALGLTTRKQLELFKTWISTESYSLHASHFKLHVSKISASTCYTSTRHVWASSSLLSLLFLVQIAMNHTLMARDILITTCLTADIGLLLSKE